MRTGRLLGGSEGGHAPPPPPKGKFWISDLRSFLVYSWGEIVKLDDLLLNLVDVFETRRIKGVTPLRAAEAAK